MCSNPGSTGTSTIYLCEPTLFQVKARTIEVFMFHLLCDGQITKNKRPYAVQHQVFLAKDLQSGLDPANLYKNQYPK